LALLTLPVSAQDRARPANPPFSGRRLALVVGNQNYSRRPLRNARADARSMDALLQGNLGFQDVRRVEDVTLPAFERAIGEFVRQVRPGDLALFYYSGHGIQVDGVNWMIPVDFHADFEDEVSGQALAAQHLLKELEDAGAAVRIIILDACRDNPLPAASRRSAMDGLAAMSGAQGTYVLFSTGENQTADDNPRGVNGLFTSYLIEAMRKPGITLDAAFKEARRAVVEASRGRQRPWLLTDIDRDLVLLPPRDAAADAWNSVRTSTDASLIEAFLKEFGSSDYAAAARSHLSVLRSVGPVAGAWAGETRVNPNDGLQYVWIPPGRFRMGCSDGDTECSDNEKPAHDVRITHGFWLGRTPVTQAASQRVVGKNPSFFNGSNLPVDSAGWEEARTYCGRIGARLPTEAEWEYAARAGTTGSRYGDLAYVAWYGEGKGRTHESGLRRANAWGLYDMLGNVWQWVADWYEPYAQIAVDDPQGPPGGQFKLLRGGSWYSPAQDVRASDRWRVLPSGQAGLVGFRCVLE
jgi:formylglycine-generating enzyme required for sulfatase activity